MWRNITRPLWYQDRYIDMFSSNIGKSLSDGSRFKFWWDDQADGVVLKEAFLRIFALSVDKEGKMQEFGRWLNNN